MDLSEENNDSVVSKGGKSSLDGEAKLFLPPLGLESGLSRAPVWSEEILSLQDPDRQPNNWQGIAPPAS